jgi:hypothetical protein
MHMAKRPARAPRPKSLSAREIEGLVDGKLKKTTFWVPEPMLDRMAAAAKHESRPVSGLLREFIVDGLKKREGHNGLFG